MNWQTTVWPRLQSAGFLVFLAVAGLCVGLLFLPLLRRNHALRGELLRLDREIARQEKIEKQQLAEAESLKTDPAYVERTARNKLNLSRPAEMIFRFEPAPTPPGAAAPKRQQQP
jgi:cell division protein DivIC